VCNEADVSNVMTDLVVRRPKFDFADDVPWEWNPQNPAFSSFMNATSMIAICFEQLIVAAVQEAKPLTTDPAVAAEATAFLRKEAQHSSAHRKHVNALIEHHPGLQQTFDEATASYDHLTATTSLEYRLAYVADLEATFTPFFKMLLDHEDTLFRPGDERVASLLMWHFVEKSNDDAAVWDSGQASSEVAATSWRCYGSAATVRQRSSPATALHHASSVVEPDALSRPGKRTASRVRQSMVRPLGLRRRHSLVFRRAGRLIRVQSPSCSRRWRCYASPRPPRLRNRSHRIR
jgi:hypothetical protein